MNIIKYLIASISLLFMINSFGYSMNKLQINDTTEYSDFINMINNEQSNIKNINFKLSLDKIFYKSPILFENKSKMSNEDFDFEQLQINPIYYTPIIYGKNQFSSFILDTNSVDTTKEIKIDDYLPEFEFYKNKYLTIKLKNGKSFNFILKITKINNTFETSDYLFKLNAEESQNENYNLEFGFSLINYFGSYYLVTDKEFLKSFNLIPNADQPTSSYFFKDNYGKKKLDGYKYKDEKFFCLNVNNKNKLNNILNMDNSLFLFKLIEQKN